jgi:uncharacterized membrane protein YheB (UPF0754 family)
MTNREFYKAVIGANVSEELKEFAKSEIEKLDKKNEKRKNTQTKEQKANEGIKSQIVEFIKENGSSVASVIATGVGVSTQKASALCKLLCEDKVLVVSDIKVKNKGTLKQYALAEVETEDSADTVEDSADNE